MAKKIIRLTESELNQIIKEATAKVMNEMDAATYSRIHNASHRAMQDIQNGKHKHIGSRITWVRLSNSLVEAKWACQRTFYSHLNE